MLLILLGSSVTAWGAFVLLRRRRDSVARASVSPAQVDLLAPILDNTPWRFQLKVRVAPAKPEGRWARGTTRIWTRKGSVRALVATIPWSGLDDHIFGSRSVRVFPFGNDPA